MYDVELTAKAKKDLKKLEKTIQEIILKKLFTLRNNPFSKVKRLKGKNLWRMRISQYRAILDILISGRKIIVLRIGHRRNIYDNI